MDINISEKELKGLPKQNKSWHDKRLRALRYIGSKIRIAPKIAEQLHCLGDSLVDIFGGSGAVIMNAGFDKRIYNDIDGDVVNFFLVMQSDSLRSQLLRMLENSPMSRAIFDHYHSQYVDNNFSFEGMETVERAYAFFYKSSFSFGGKIRNGGFAATLSDRGNGCKEIKRFFGILEHFEKLGDFWKGTVIENLPFDQLIRAYEKRPNLVFYADPPYVGTEGYYSNTFKDHDHFTLSTMLTHSPAAAVVSYYDCDRVRELYRPEDGWEYVEIVATKNSLGRSKGHTKVTELLIIKE